MYRKEEERNLFAKTRDVLDPQHAMPSWEEELTLIRQLVRYHEWKYYVQNDPVIADYDYDLLFKKLESIEAAHPEAITPDSPTQRVSSDLTSDFPTAKHLTPMLSLANSYNAEDLRDFDTSVRKLLHIEGDIAYAVEPKFDGGSISLIYEDDLLARAATRGNGQQGDEMTANAKTIRSIPLRADFSRQHIRRIEVRGEAIIPKASFDEINEKRAEAGLPLFANARNAATGGLRMKDPNDTARRGIEAFVYQISHIDHVDGLESEGLTTQWERMNYLQGLGFKVPGPARKKCNNIEEVIAFCEDWERRRDTYPYEIDGMVVKVNRLDYQQVVGSTSHHPRWAIAFKFKAKQATTQLLSIEYQVGKIGSITPVAKLEPVQLAGVTVSSVSLHNEDFITGKDLRLGDQVVVERAGDVIPHIVKALPDLRDGSEQIIHFPRTCPINTEEEITLVREDDESAWRCPTCSCGAQDLQRMIFHVSKVAMNIDGFGRSMVERFYELGWLRTLADIYRLDYSQIAALEGFGEKSAAKLQQSIDRAKKNPIKRLLHSLSIHHLGKKASQILAERIGHVLELAQWTEEDYTEIKDIGPVLAQNMVRFFADESHVRLLQELETLGVNLRQTEEDRPIEITSDAPLAGKTILFTGTLTHLSRKEAQGLAAKHGAKNISAVSSNLDILVVGEKAGSKLRKAEALGTVQILSEEAFLQMLPDEPSL